MAHPNKVKSRRAELAVARYLVEQGFPYAEPTRRSGWADDRGDIDGLPGVCLEVKDAKVFRRDEWIGELRAEMDNRGVELGSLVIKKHGTLDVGQWYALLPVAVLVRLLHAASD